VRDEGKSKNRNNFLLLERSFGARGGAFLSLQYPSPLPPFLAKMEDAVFTAK